MKKYAWPTADPQDQKHIYEHMLVWSVKSGVIYIARRCAGCRKLFARPWETKTEGETIRCKSCAKGKA